MPSSRILPGSTLGVLGSGQLGRMFAIAARQMGYRVHTYSPDTDTPTGQVADVEVVASYSDLAAIHDFASHVDVVTFEFENVPAEAVRAAADHAPVRPSGNVLYVSQNRLREKTFLADRGIPVTPFARTSNPDELLAACKRLGLPAILKTAGFGYDGKGQLRIETEADLNRATDMVREQECILEAFIDFERELSVVAARGVDGDYVDWGVVENQHRHHILDLSIAPARVSLDVSNEARRITRAILEALDVVGVMCVEFFLTPDQQIYVNEIAPRPHNSGHWTIDGAATSQFEQQLRAVCGLPLGSTELLRPSAMANLLGNAWEGGEPDWAAACSVPGVKLHLYGKSEARAGRKMGHLTALSDTQDEAIQRVCRARELLRRRPTPKG